MKFKKLGNDLTALGCYGLIRFTIASRYVHTVWATSDYFEALYQPFKEEITFMFSEDAIIYCLDCERKAVRMWRVRCWKENQARWEGNRPMQLIVRLIPDWINARYYAAKRRKHAGQ